MINKYKKQAGFGIVAMIVTIVGILSVISFFALRGTDTSAVLNNSAITNTIVAQAGVIRARILSCSIEYPTGNNATGFRPQYPAATSAVNVSTLTCPGAGNANIWTLLDGVSAPISVNGFNAWQYVNDGTSMRIMITATTPEKIGLLPTLVTMLGSNQASVATTPANTLVWVIAN